MKRALALLIIVAAVVAGFFSVRGALPFLPILGTSMEPEYKAGDLITIEEVSATEVEVGDIIVFTVPPLVREAYGYPEVVVHRVVRAYTTDRDTTFRTQGDNVEGEDPFMVRARDLKGQPSSRIPYLGFPLLYLQSQHGLIFIVVSLCLLTLYLYTEELSRGSGMVQKRVLAPVLEENRRNSHLLERRIATTEKGVIGTEQALTRFASAIDVYATHLQSHTSAVQGLSEASHELKWGAAEQNKVLSRLTEVIERIASPQRIEVGEQPERQEGQAVMAQQEGEQLPTGREMAVEGQIQTAKSEIEGKFAEVYEELRPAGDHRVDSRPTTARPIGMDMTSRELHEPHTPASAGPDDATEGTEEQLPPTAEEASTERDTSLYDGRVEVRVLPPIGVGRVLQLYKSLASIPQLESVDMKVYEDKGITYSLVLREPTPLLQVLRGLPEVDDIRDAGRTGDPRHTGVQDTVASLLLTPKR